jgi:hypothetical protein
MVVNVDTSVCIYGWSLSGGSMTFQIPVDHAQMQWFLAAVTAVYGPGQTVAVKQTSSSLDTVNGVYMVEVLVSNNSLTPGSCEFELRIAETQP